MMEESMRLCQDVRKMGEDAEELRDKIMTWSLRYWVKPEENPFFPELTDALAELTDLINDLAIE